MTFQVIHFHNLDALLRVRQYGLYSMNMVGAPHPLWADSHQARILGNIGHAVRASNGARD